MNGLSSREDGPFFQHLADRKDKGFTAILMQYFHGYGDYPDSPGHRNEGGKPYLDIRIKTLNPANFQSLDVRLRALGSRVRSRHSRDMVGKNQPLRLPAGGRTAEDWYFAVLRPFNAIWSLSGE